MQLRQEELSPPKALPFKEVANGLTQHFANNENGVIEERATAEERCRRRRHEVAAVLQNVPIQREDLPHVEELTAAIQTVKAGKAFAGDPIPPELLRADPAVTAEVLYPLFLWFCAWQQQAYAHKGGIMAPIPKGGGEAFCVPVKYRGILITAVIPRIFHAVLRKRLFADIEPQLSPFHFGGRAHQGVSFAAHVVRTAIARADAMKLSLSFSLILLGRTTLWFAAWCMVTFKKQTAAMRRIPC